jgi:hypothetical protein
MDYSRKINNMKKIVRLNESELISMIKKIIVETTINEELEVTPYKLKAVSGKIKVTNTNTNKTLTYELETSIVGFRKSVYVNSIGPDDITISVAGIEKTKPLSKDKLSKILKNGFGTKEIEYTTKDGDIVYFVLKS